MCRLPFRKHEFSAPFRGPFAQCEMFLNRLADFRLVASARSDVMTLSGTKQASESVLSAWSSLARRCIVSMVLNFPLYLIILYVIRAFYPCHDSDGECTMYPCHACGLWTPTCLTANTDSA